MAQPTHTSLHIDTAATNFSVAYRNQNYIAEQILPNIAVSKQTGKYFKFSKGPWMRNSAGVRAPGARSPLVEYTMDTAGSYACLEYSAAYLLPDESRENADNPLVPERTAAEFVTDKVLLAREVRAAALLFSTTTFSGYTQSAAATTIGTAGVAWDTYETSDPLQDVNAMKYTIIATIGFVPNVLIVGGAVDKALRQHPVILDRVKWTQKGIVTNDLLASLFDVQKYLPGYAISNSSIEGVTPSYADVWGKYALLAYVPPSPALESPALGYTLTWKNRQINRFRQDENHADLFECIENVDEIVCAADAGYLLSSVVA